jgi:hypothetical protein
MISTSPSGQGIVVIPLEKYSWCKRLQSKVFEALLFKVGYKFLVFSKTNEVSSVKTTQN